MWLISEQLPAQHGFSTRKGGVSLPPFDSLNFDDRQDDPAQVEENRRLGLAALGFRPEQVARLNQVHSCDVVQAHPGVQTGDALVSRDQGVVLAIGTADCYPILFHDPVNGVIGAAHAGWRGTVGRIAQRTLRAMQDLGAELKHTRAAIGPGISVSQYQVGKDVADQFMREGFPAQCLQRDHHLDLLAANVFVLEEAGLQPEQIWTAGRCSTEPEFFSYRRDAGVTGRMWAVIGQ
ncbi:peptidoglycan editing factor PgeF [Deinococcus cellulosilyticus]|uniref:Purine nucleoside phosphorylase n=1 Tax=Deinococcus cellulosilyticus (strain DSM 18568 / NBRC 106333 / KACC 11606 / 5516J-15) TaxID=1223518 RepID=A0A511MYQ0_DEIC1|nr:peptidoglycan editing factor PgeF [Deinococcus cellulosilyticus]GEM45725.1 laccase domain protein [Deinococcus cellulosilyticus NBRC 106333 = KACC 11606]